MQILEDDGDRMIPARAEKEVADAFEQQEASSTVLGRAIQYPRVAAPRGA